MTDLTWFRVDRPTAKWHMTRAVVPGSDASDRVHLGVCGTGVGEVIADSIVLTTDVEPPLADTCHRCAKRGSHRG
jgi:hypothetical protein